MEFLEPSLVKNFISYHKCFMNTGEQTRTFHIGITGIDGIRLASDGEVTVAGGEIGTQTAVVTARQPGPTCSTAK